MTAVTDYRLCECGLPLVAEGRGWKHLDGFYRCPVAHGRGPGTATPLDPVDMAERERVAFDDGYETAQEDMEFERDALRDEGRDEGWDDCASAVRDVLANYRGDSTGEELAHQIEGVL